MTLLLCSALLFSACAAAPESASEPSQDKGARVGTSGAAQEKQEPVVRDQNDGKAHVIRIQDGGRVIVLPEGGAEIEGKGAIRFEDGGKLIRFDGDVQTLVDGEVVEDSEAKPGQRVEVQDGSGKTLWVLSLREPQKRIRWQIVDGSGGTGVDAGQPRFRSEIVTDGARTYWVDAIRNGDVFSAEPAQGKYSVNATDGRGSFRLEVEDGKLVAAEVDGKAIPLDSIEQKGSRVRIPGQGGKGDLELTLQPSGGLHWRSRRAPQGYLGVQTTRPDDALAEHLGLQAGEVELVSSVVAGGPAERGGVEAHDIITHVDGLSPITTKKLAEIVRAKKPGEKVSVRVLRKGKPVELTFALGERKPDDAAMSFDPSAFDAGEKYVDWLNTLGAAKTYSGKALERWQDYVHTLPNGAYALGPSTSTGAGQVEDIVKRLEEQHRRLEEQLERLEQQQRELQALEERLQKLGAKSQGGR